MQLYTQLPPESDGRALMMYPHSTLPIAQSTSRYESTGSGQVKELLDEVAKCNTKKGILQCTRQWLKKQNYGERQYISETIAKKRRVGWSPVD